jgi:two-component system response regulator YesN
VDFISIEEKNEEDFTTKIVEFIHEHYQENLTLTSLSQKFGYSPNYFSGLFNRYLGTGVSQYLNSVRIQKSIALLQEKSVEEIAHACGYNSPQQYYLNFKKIHGCSPKEYLYKEL